MMIFKFILLSVLITCVPMIGHAIEPNLDAEYLSSYIDDEFSLDEDFQVIESDINDVNYILIQGMTYNLFDEPDAKVYQHLSKLNKLYLYQYVSDSTGDKYRFSGFRQGLTYKYNDKYILISYIGKNDLAKVSEASADEEKNDVPDKSQSTDHFAEHTFESEKKFGKGIESRMYKNTDEYQYLIKQIDLLENKISQGKYNHKLLQVLYGYYRMKPNLEKAYEIREKILQL